MRFAFQALKELAQGRLGRAVLPQSGAEWMMSVAPNLAFAGMTALNQPEGTGGLLRLGAGAEDLAGSLALQTLGRGLGHGLVAGGRRMGVRMDPEWAMGIKSAGEMGTEMLGYGLVPRPFGSSALQGFEERMSEKQQAELAARDEEVRRQALAEAGIRGAMLPPDMQQWSLQSGLMGGFG